MCFLSATGICIMELSQNVQQGLALASSSALTDEAALVIANYAACAALGSEDLGAWEGRDEALPLYTITPRTATTPVVLASLIHRKAAGGR